MNRISIKIAGQSGQGINVIGEILAKSLKRSGFFTFGYREYPSLIKGGNASYQVDVADQQILGPEFGTDIEVVINRQATKWYLDEMKENSIIFHDIENPRINKEEFEVIQKKNIKLIHIPAMKLSIEAGGNYVTSNIVTVGTLWKFLGQDYKIILEIVKKAFADKPQFLEVDIKCLEKGYTYENFELPSYTKKIIKKDEITQDEKSSVHITGKKVFELIKDFKSKQNLKNDYLMTGNDALSFGAVNGGVRIYYGYPMTPASSILTTLADNAHQTGMIVKQTEDEITAVAMTIGSMHMGVRAFVGTSGGGFDLMAEHISLSGMLEIPLVILLAQRAGPATGLPTWTAQGDLLGSIFTGHGEFARCVMAVRDAEDCFYGIQEAENIAEKYQIPVVLLTDKMLAESIFQVPEFDYEKINIERGEILNPNDKTLQDKILKRYEFTESGISPRWFPGDNLTDFDSNSDEHDEFGTGTEDAEPGAKMIEKRLKKLDTLKNKLPDPEVFSNKPRQVQKEINLIGWGSTYTSVHDIFNQFEKENIKVNYMDIKYLWPLKTEPIVEYLKKDNVVLIENNHNEQLRMLIRMQTGLDIPKVIKRWDGRPFFVDELLKSIISLVI